MKSDGCVVKGYGNVVGHYVDIPSEIYADRMWSKDTLFDRMMIRRRGR